jgi:hypothetical protein
MQVIHDLIDPQFDDIRAKMVTKDEMAEHMKNIHQRFDRLEAIMRG